MQSVWSSFAARAAATSLLCTVLFAGVPARADIAISVSPARLEFELDPGQSDTKEIHLLNRGAQNLQAVVYITDMLVGPNGEALAGSAGNVTSPAASWVSVRPDRTLVAPGKVATFQVNVALPATVHTGGYLAMFVNTVPAVAEGGFSAPTAAEIGVQCLIRATSSTPELGIKVLEVRPPTAANPLVAEVELSNVGPVHAWADVSMDLLGPLEDFVGTVVPTTPGRTLLLPGQRKTIKLEWPGELPPAKYDGIATVYYDRDQAAVAETSFVVSAADRGPAPNPPPRAPVRSAPVVAGSLDRGSGTAALPLPELSEPEGQKRSAKIGAKKVKAGKKARRLKGKGRKR